MLLLNDRMESGVEANSVLHLWDCFVTLDKVYIFQENSNEMRTVEKSL